MDRRQSFCRVREEKLGSSSYAMRDMPLSMRPREAVDRFGVQNVPDETLLALILRTGARGLSVVGVAEELIHRYGKLDALARSSVSELECNRIPGLGHVKAQILAAAFELGRRSVQGQASEPKLRTPEDVARLLSPASDGLQQEHFWVILLDVKNRMIGRVLEITKGVLDASLVSPREAFKEAVRCAAKSVIVAHNHPTGDCSPSSQDLKVTRDLLEAGKVLGISLCDHLILASKRIPDLPPYISIRESGLVAF